MNNFNYKALGAVFGFWLAIFAMYNIVKFTLEHFSGDQIFYAFTIVWFLFASWLMYGIFSLIYRNK